VNIELVSVIMPAYNSEYTISRSIESILSQTYKNLELLITDDFSNDNTINIIKKYIKIDHRVKLFQFTSNSGAGVARNNSIKKSIGRYIAFCDSDDMWLENKLEIQIKFLKKSQQAFTFSSYYVSDEKGKIIRKVKAPKIINLKMLYKNNYVGCLTAIYDTKMLGKIYMPKIRKRQDWALWIQIIKKIHQCQSIESFTSIYMDRSSSISSNKISLIFDNYNFYNKVLGFNKFKSFNFMLIFIFYYLLKKIK
tara:strand:+ start:12764 stop:13516 length:753 start_codon:yes stop_codon:yes gene_type:complete